MRSRDMATKKGPAWCRAFSISKLVAVAAAVGMLAGLIVLDLVLRGLFRIHDRRNFRLLRRWRRLRLDGGLCLIVVLRNRLRRRRGRLRIAMTRVLAIEGAVLLDVRAAHRRGRG